MKHHRFSARTQFVVPCLALSLLLTGCPSSIREVTPPALQSTAETHGIPLDYRLGAEFEALFPPLTSLAANDGLAERRQQAFVQKDPAAWACFQHLPLMDWGQAGCGYMAAHRDEAPANLQELASFIFTWPMAGPSSREYAQLSELDRDSLPAGQVVADVAASDFRVGLELDAEARSLRVLSVRVLNGEPRYVTKELEIGGRGVGGDTSKNRNRYLAPKTPFDLALTATTADPEIAWAQTSQTAARLRAIPQDARVAEAARQLTGMLNTAMSNAGRMPASVEELEYYSFRRLCNLEPSTTDAAHIVIEYDGAQAYRLRLFYPSGAVNDSIMWCAGHDADGWLSSKQRPFAVYERFRPGAAASFQPFASLRLADPEHARLPVQPEVKWQSHKADFAADSALR